VNISQNWLNGATPDKFFQADNVTFDDTSGVPTTITLVGNLFPSSVTVNSSNNNYTFTGTGVIGGAGSLTKSGTSTLTLSQTASNTYTGGTTINGGAVILTTTQATLGTGSVVMNNNSTLQFNASKGNDLSVNGTVALVYGDNQNVTYSGALSGSGTVNVYTLGAGSLVNYSGAMDQFSGTLNLGNITGGSFRLNNGGANTAAGGPNLILDLGTAPVTFNNRNGTTITLGGLIGGSGPILSGAQTGTGTTTYSIGAANLSTTFAGNIVDGGVSPNFAVTNVTKVGTASLTLSGNNTYTGVTTVQAGKLVLQGNAKNPVLTGVGGADVQGGRLILDYNDTGNAPDVKSILTAGYAQSPKFSAGQIRTSNPADTAKGLGWKDDPTAKQETIAYTWYGDANLDGQVDVTDLGALATNWQTSNVWAGGDFDYSGFVDVTDLGALATNWQQGVGNPLGPGSLESAMAAVGLGNVSVPEPASIGLMGLGLAGVVSRRRRHRTAR
jgi:autotransporter-associated beta strand protein